MNIICCECGHEFNTDEHNYGGYSSIAKCPKCKCLNSIGHLMT